MTDVRAYATTIATILALAARVAHADGDDADDPADKPLAKPRLSAAQRQDIVIDTPGERSTANLTVLVGLATTSLACGVLGLHYQLSAKTQGDMVAADAPTGRIWTPNDQATLDSADRQRTRAIVFYSIGGGLLLGAIVTLIATVPRGETTVIHPHTAMLQPTIVPVEGGAVLGGGWSF